MQGLKWKKISLNHAWKCEQELAELKGELGRKRVTKPATLPDPPTQAARKVDFYMKEMSKTPMAEAVKEIVELPRVKEAIHRLLASPMPGDVEAALRTLGPLLSALSRLTKAPKEDDKAPVLDDSLD